MINNASSETVFGIHAVQVLLLRNPGRVKELLVQQGKFNPRIKKLLVLAAEKNVALRQVDAVELDELVEGNHQGVVAHVLAQTGFAEGDLSSLLAQHAEPLLLILDGVTDPHNLGACLRSADAAGVTAVIVPKDKSASITPVVSKVASGAAETLPFIQVTNLARTLRQLKDMGVWITGTAVDPESKPLYQADLTGSRALVMGSEGDGMRRLTREHCDELVYIPMAGEVSSLNVSVAAGVCLFEAVRQRQG